MASSVSVSLNENTENDNVTKIIEQSIIEDEEDLDLGSNDMEMEMDSDDESIIPPLQNPELDPNYEFVNLLLGGIRRLTPEMRELARLHIHRILEQYLQPDMYDFAPRPSHSLPRYSPHG